MKMLTLVFSLLFGQPAVKDFSPVQNVRLVVVSASWCGPCQRLKLLTLPEVKRSFPVEVVDGDTDKTYSVSSYPTIICFVGSEEKWRQSGFVSSSALLDRVRSTVSKSATKKQTASSYAELHDRIKHGESLTVAVGVSDESADIYVKSIKGCEPGVWSCFLENGQPMMRKVK